MAKTIWKYQLAITDRQKIEIPRDSKLLFVGLQDGILCLWALVDSLAPKIDRLIAVVGTGNPAPESYRASYIGSVINDPFVWHVFDGWGL